MKKNLLDFYNAIDEFDQMFAEFFVTPANVRCYWCKCDSTDTSDYKNVTKYGFGTDENVFAGINYTQIIEIDHAAYIVVTGTSCSSFHCNKCKNGPIEISDEDMNQYKKHIIEARNILRKEIGYDFNVRIINRRSKTYGSYNPIDPLMIEINIGAISESGRSMTMKEAIFSTSAHEARHLWQHHNGWEFDHTLEYYDRPHEVDARAYAEEFINKTFKKELV